MNERLYHIALKVHWEKAKPLGVYRPLSLMEEGFIHLSTPKQLNSVLERFYKDSKQVVILEIDPSRLSHPLKYEKGEDGTELYPHLYGPLNLNAVMGTRPAESFK